MSIDSHASSSSFIEQHDRLLPTGSAMPKERFFGLTWNHICIFFAAWLGFGFDFFDALLFNELARYCVPDLLGLPREHSSSDVTFWRGILSAAVLIGWAVGGAVFGYVADKYGRTKTLLSTIILFSVCTALCAAAPNVWLMLLFRFLIGLGIGGEVGAGATLVAEAMPPKLRTVASSLLFSSACLGDLMAITVGGIFTDQSTSLGRDSNNWRYAFLTGLIPAFLTIVIRWKVKEPEAWVETHTTQDAASFKELFQPNNRRQTINGLVVCGIALVGWWSFSTFTPDVIDAIAQGETEADDLNLLSGTLNTVATLSATGMVLVAAFYMKRTHMFLIVFVASAASIFFSLLLDMSARTRLYAFFSIQFWTNAPFALFPVYLPELFPMRIRALGYGLCYNFGRLAAAAGLFIIGAVTKAVKDSPDQLLTTVSYIGILPSLGALFLLANFGYETFGKGLTESTDKASASFVTPTSHDNELRAPLLHGVKTA
eukprot:GILK01009142.1.p1 GENE.GILK01009142.1~~GILK01009142.1.p1  ORF type:complete len:486 (+),score=79.01 GILK01009142.1:38-1495(+)